MKNSFNKNLTLSKYIRPYLLYRYIVALVFSGHIILRIAESYYLFLGTSEPGELGVRVPPQYLI